jgi:hypothetical protein
MATGAASATARLSCAASASTPSSCAAASRRRRRPAAARAASRRRPAAARATPSLAATSTRRSGPCRGRRRCCPAWPTASPGRGPERAACRRAPRRRTARRRTPWCSTAKAATTPPAPAFRSAAPAAPAAPSTWPPAPPRRREYGQSNARRVRVGATGRPSWGRCSARVGAGAARGTLCAVGCGLAGCGRRRPCARCRLGGLAPRGLAAAVRRCLQPAWRASRFRRRRRAVRLSRAVRRRCALARRAPRAPRQPWRRQLRPRRLRPSPPRRSLPARRPRASRPRCRRAQVPSAGTARFKIWRRRRAARLSPAVRGRRTLARRASLRAARSAPRASLRAVGCGLAGCGRRRPGARCRLGGLAPRGLAAAPRGCLPPARRASRFRRRWRAARLSLAARRRRALALRAALCGARPAPGAKFRAVGCGLAGCGRRRPCARCRLGGLASHGLAAAVRGCLLPARRASRAALRGACRAPGANCPLPAVAPPAAVVVALALAAAPSALRPRAAQEPSAGTARLKALPLEARDAAWPSLRGRARSLKPRAGARRSPCYQRQPLADPRIGPCSPRRPSAGARKSPCRRITWRPGGGQPGSRALCRKAAAAAGRGRSCRPFSSPLGRRVCCAGLAAAAVGASAPATPSGVACTSLGQDLGGDRLALDRSSNGRLGARIAPPAGQPKPRWVKISGAASSPSPVATAAGACAPATLAGRPKPRCLAGSRLGCVVAAAGASTRAPAQVQRQPTPKETERRAACPGAAAALLCSAAWGPRLMARLLPRPRRFQQPRGGRGRAALVATAAATRGPRRRPAPVPLAGTARQDASPAPPCSVCWPRSRPARIRQCGPAAGGVTAPSPPALPLAAGGGGGGMPRAPRQPSRRRPRPRRLRSSPPSRSPPARRPRASRPRCRRAQVP